MNQIQLTEEELMEMKRLYQGQLAEAQRKVAHLKAILNKFDGGPQIADSTEEISISETTDQATAEPKKTSLATVSYIPEMYIPRRGPGQKRPKDRKSAWGSYMQTVLRTSNKLMTSSEILERAMKRKKNIEKGEDKTRLSILAAMHRLTRVSYRIRTMRVKGQPGLFYGLVSRFNVDGSLKDGFDQFGPLTYEVKEAKASQVVKDSPAAEKVSPAAPKKKRGRPAGSGNKKAVAKKTGAKRGRPAKAASKPVIKKVASKKVTTAKKTAKPIAAKKTTGQRGRKAVAPKAPVKRTGAKRGRPAGSKNKKK
jgi:hypothetical protein